jgi:transposase
MDSSTLSLKSAKVGVTKTKGAHTMNNTTTICIDLAKDVFQIAIFNRAGREKLNKEVSAKKMCEIIHQYPAADIFMEACGSAHYWARRFSKSGHKVGLIPPHFAAKFRSGNKSDKNDAIAIFDASRSSQLNCVAIRTLEQQDIATLHKMREGYKKERNQIANRMRGFAREYGVIFALGIPRLRKQVPQALEDAENELTVMGRRVLAELLEHLIRISDQFDNATKEIDALAKQILPCKNLTTLPGIGPLNATMLYAKLGTGASFRRGRDASASLGIVPSHSGSGGTVMIGRITKRGDVYVRSLVINGARAAVSSIGDKTDGFSSWIRKLLLTKSYNVAVVAVANKLVRMALAMLKSGERYHQPVAQA